MMKREHGKIRVGMVKAKSHWGSIEKNICFLEELLTPLKDNKIDVVITPECFLDGYMVEDNFEEKKEMY